MNSSSDENKILIIEDDENILSANRQLLELSGYSVITAGTLAEGRKAVREERPDLILLDILLPDGSGLDFCRELRQDSDVRILFLSALGTRKDIIEGLREGGDDYLAKPFLTEELLLRVAALLRRTVKQDDVEKTTAWTGPIEWNSASGRAYIYGEDLMLPPREYAILYLLCRDEGNFFTPEEIYRTVWNAGPGQDVRTVHSRIYSLRAKLFPYGITIESQRGLGYRILWKQ
jgi:DNA-binding response OmpR family regulator